MTIQKVSKNAMLYTNIYSVKISQTQLSFDDMTPVLNPAMRNSQNRR